jgi:AAA15 family ATPase/GTPase
LHNKLEELLIKYFFKESKRSQLLLVSHSTNLLKFSILRLDQIYIVDMDEEGSKLKRLSNENIRISQNLEKMYLSGMFGGVPLYDPFE